MPTDTIPACPTGQAIPFTFNDHEVRVIMRDGEPWWVARDICDVLDLDNVTMALRALDDDERDTLNTTEGICPDGRAQAINLINEPGLYSLVLRSRKPEAKQFKRWVVHEVLPAIRKTGGYQAPTSLVDRIRLMLEIAERQEQLATHQVQISKQVDTVQRVAQAALDKAESNFGTYSVLGFARLHGIHLGLQQAAAHGSRLTCICDQRGIAHQRIRDPRFGFVNTYPEQVLADYFRLHGLIPANKERINA